MPLPQLNDEQKGLLKIKQFSLHRTAADTVAFLAPIAQWDAVGDKERTRMGCGAAVSFVLAIAAFFGAAAVSPLLTYVAFLLIAVGIVLIVMWSRKKSEDLSDNLRESALPILAALRDDFGPDPIVVKLDLRPPMSPAKKTHEEKTPGTFKTVLSTYVDPWMSCQGTLADGSKIEWSVVDTIFERKRWKKSTSGKYKQKTKLKKKTDVEVAVTLKTKRYELGTIEGADVKAGENKNTVRISRKLKTTENKPIVPAEVLDVITGVYRQLRPAR